jgi:hypothetical protein
VLHGPRDPWSFAVSAFLLALGLLLLLAGNPVAPLAYGWIASSASGVVVAFFMPPRRPEPSTDRRLLDAAAEDTRTGHSSATGASGTGHLRPIDWPPSKDPAGYR